MNDPGEPVEIFRGPMGEAYVIRSALQARGIRIYIRDETIKIMDPFITGANGLDVVMFCAADQVAEARAILGTDVPPPRLPARHEARAEAEGEDLAALGRRVRWAVLSLVLTPIAAVLGLRYLLRTLATGASPPDHGKTVLAACFAWLVVFVGLVVLLSGCGAGRVQDIATLTVELEVERDSYVAAGRMPSVGPEDGEGLTAYAQVVVNAARERGFQRFRSDGYRAALANLKGAVASGPVSPADVRRVEELLAGLLARDPPAREAWWGPSLLAQEIFEQRLRGDPSDRDALEAWASLRRHLDPDAPDLDGLRREARDSDNARFAVVAAEILLAAERLPAIDEGLKRDLEAVILALHVQRYREETGEWPADLSTVRPDTVPASPLGMRWELDTDPETRAPAIFLRGGKRFGTAQGEPKGFHADGPEKPLFRFEP